MGDGGNVVLEVVHSESPLGHKPVSGIKGKAECFSGHLEGRVDDVRREVEVVRDHGKCQNVNKQNFLLT